MRTGTGARTDRLVLVIAVLACTLHGLAERAVAAQPPPVAVAEKPSLAARAAARVEQELKDRKIVGLGVALGRGDAIVYSAGFGLADRDRGEAVSGASMFRWASISKPLTAVAALLLEKEGRLDLDADVRRYVPEFPERSTPLTSRQLLAHLGGIVHYTNGLVIKTERSYSTEHPFEDVVLALDTFKDSPPVWTPGTTYSYSTHGYILASAVVQRAAMAPYAEVVRKRIAEPCGMVSLRPDYQWESIPNRVKGYRRTKDGEVVNSTDTDVSWKLGGGGWISTTDDLARFGLGMLGRNVVDADTRKKLWTEQKTPDGKGTGYGLGFNVRLRDDGQLQVGHTGSQEKTATLLMILPDAVASPAGASKQGIVVALMCNTEDTNLRPLANDLAKLLLEPLP